MVAAALIAPSSAHPNIPVRQCGEAASFRSFSAKTWAPQHWRRRSPSARVLQAKRKRLDRAEGCGYRGKLRATWEREKRAFYRHRAYKLRWGNCGDAGPIRDCIHGAALTYGADEGWMLGVSMCESRWNRYAANASGATGLFQFLGSTWASTPYGSKSIYSVKWQSLAAAWMQVNGRESEWVCQG